MNTPAFETLAYDAARSLIEDAAWTLEPERVDLDRAIGRVLAETIVSDMDMPPFDKSAVDGYACLRDDLPGELDLLETIPAGHAPNLRLHSGACTKVMTGAPVPDGAECVVMVERSELRGNGRVYLSAAPEGRNIIPRAEDVAAGQKLLRAGARLAPAHLAVLATAGCVRPKVHALPKVGIISTGTEIVPPDQKPGPAQIRNSNGTQLRALCATMGIEAKCYGVAEDSEASLAQALRIALEECTVVLSTGGVSMGDYDLVPETLEQLGLRLRLRRVAIQPGKPIAFGTGNGRAAFGLSGNPNSSYLQFELFVRPFLMRLQGARHVPIEVLLPAAENFTRKHADRLLWLPVVINAQGHAERVRYHGSAHIHSYTVCQGLMQLPPGTTQIAKGDHLRVRLLS